MDNNSKIIIYTIVFIFILCLCLTSSIALAVYANKNKLFPEEEETNNENNINEGMTNIKPYCQNQEEYVINNEIENLNIYDPYDPYINNPENEQEDEEISAKITDKNFDKNMVCTKVNRTYFDNFGVKYEDDKYLCLSKNLGLKWSNEGNIDDMKCTKIIDPFDANGWDNDYLCLPHDSNYNLMWSQNGKLPKRKNIKWNNNPDDKNYLCLNNFRNNKSNFHEF